MKLTYNLIKKALAVSLLASFLVACTGYEPEVSVSEETAEINSQLVLQNRGFDLFLDAVAHAGISEEIFGGDTVTIFAPTNAAFTNLFAELGVDAVTDIDASVLANILRYHVTTGAIRSASLSRRIQTALTGKSIVISANADGVKSVNAAANFATTDLVSSDAIIHGVSTVLSPPIGNLMATLEADEDLSVLVSAIERVGLDATLSGSTEYTILAPDNAAFDGVDLAALSDAELTAILSFHVIAGTNFSIELPAVGGKVASILGVEADGQQELVIGDGPSFNGSAVSSANILADNGVIHKVSAIIEESTVVQDAFGTSLDITFGNDAILTDLFGSLVASAGYTGFDDLTKTFTIYTQLFGPSDVSAFASPEAAIDYIESRTFDGVVQIPTLPNGTKITSINGSSYFVTRTAAGGHRVNGVAGARNAFGESGGNANVNSTTAGVSFYNGSIIYPFSSGAFIPLPEEDLFQVLSANTNYSLFAQAIDVAGLSGTISSGNHTIFAVPDSVWLSDVGLGSGALDTLSASDPNDEALIAAIADALSGHIIPNNVQFAFTIGANVPTLMNLSEEEVFFAVVDGSIGIIQNAKNPQGSRVNLIGVDIRANNGVIHVLNAVLDL